MGVRVTRTLEFLPDPFRILMNEFATILALNNDLVSKLNSGFTKINPRQQLLEDKYWASVTAPASKNEKGEYNTDPLQTFLLYGSTRSGKTVGTIRVILKLLLMYPGSRALGVRRTYTELWDSLFPSIQEVLDRCNIPYTTRRDPPGFYFPNGSCWILRSAERADRTGEGKIDNLGGMEFDIAMMEEADELKELYYTTLVGRMSGKHVPRRAIFIVENPPSYEHWTYQMFFPNDTPVDDPNMHPMHFPTEDNLDNLPEGYLQNMEDKLKDFPTLYQKFRKGLFGPSATGKPIFKGIFSHDIHVNDGPITWNKNLPIIRSWDFGWRRPAVVLCQDDPDTQQIRFLRASMGHNTLLKNFAQKQITIHKNLFPGAKYRDICDIAGKRRSDVSPKSQVEVLEGLGLNLEMSYTKVEYGLNLMSDQLGTLLPGHRKSDPRPAMLFCPRGCSTLIDAFSFGYTQVDEQSHSRIGTRDELKPYKDGYYEHVMDCTRYIMVLIREITARTVPKQYERKIWRKVTPEGYFETTTSGRKKKGPKYKFGKRDQY